LDIQLNDYQLDIIQDNSPRILAVMARMTGKDTIIKERIARWSGVSIVIAPILYGIERYQSTASLFNYQQILEGTGRGIDADLTKTQVILTAPYLVRDEHIVATLEWAEKAKASRILIIGNSGDRGFDDQGKPRPDVIKDIWFNRSNWMKHHVTMFQAHFLDEVAQNRLMTGSSMVYKYEVEASMA